MASPLDKQMSYKQGIPLLKASKDVDGLQNNKDSGGRDGHVTISPQGIVSYSSDSNEEQVRNKQQDSSSSHSIFEAQGIENSQDFDHLHNEPLYQNDQLEAQPLLRRQDDIIPQQYVNGKAKDCPLLSPLVFRCSRFIFRHSKICMLCGVLIATLFLIKFVLCVVMLILYWQPTEINQEKIHPIHVAPLSVIAFDLDKHKIDSIQNQQVKVIVNTTGQSYKYRGVIEITAHNGPIHHAKKKLKVPKNLLLKTGTKLVRHWDRTPTGQITCTTYSSTGKVVWGWGNLRKKPNISCDNYNYNNSLSCNGNAIYVEDIYNQRNENNDHQVTLLFCGVFNDDYIEVNIDIDERLPELKTTCQSLYINNYAGSVQSTVVVPFQRIFNGLKAGKQSQVFLSINTEGLYNFLNDYDSIEVQLEPIRNKKIWKLEATGVGVFFLLLIITGLSIFTCYKLRRSNITYVTTGWIYHKDD